ncbi:MAG: MAPEG family protein [Sphingomonas sp.]
MELISLPITLVTAGGAAIINVWLALRVVAVRRAQRIALGDEGSPRLLARMRAQANFVEYAPFVLILIGLIELTQGPSMWLWLASVAFLLARVLHPFGMDGVRYCRPIGTAATLALLAALGLYAITLPFGAGQHNRSSMEVASPQG